MILGGLRFTIQRVSPELRRNHLFLLRVAQDIFYFFSYFESICYLRGFQCTLGLASIGGWGIIY